MAIIFVGQREHVLADGSIVYVTNIGQLGTNQQRPQQGVPAERLASFRTKVLDEQAMQAGDWDTKGKNSTCVICLDDFQAGARVKTYHVGIYFMMHVLINGYILIQDAQIVTMIV